MKNSKTKVQSKSTSEIIVMGLFRLYAVIITGMFLYGFFSVLYALIFDHSAINSANFNYAEGVSYE